MHERQGERIVGVAPQEDEGEDRGAVVAALAAAAISGFSMGLLMHGEFAGAVTVAVLVPTVGFGSWWLRGALERDRIRPDR